MSTTLSPDAFEQLPRKRAAAKLGWFIHASIYMVVNSFLVLTALYQGNGWAVFLLMG